MISTFSVLVIYLLWSLSSCDKWHLKVKNKPCMSNDKLTTRGLVCFVHFYCEPNTSIKHDPCVILTHMYKHGLVNLEFKSFVFYVGFSGNNHHKQFWRHWGMKPWMILENALRLHKLMLSTSLHFLDSRQPWLLFP